GVARRFQFRGEGRGVTFVDDYAHLPTEVRAALATAKDGGWRRVVCVFQPHRYSRTQALAPDFADAFVDADLLIVTDVYPAGEAPPRRAGPPRRSARASDDVSSRRPRLPPDRAEHGGRPPRRRGRRARDRRPRPARGSGFQPARR